MNAKQKVCKLFRCAVWMAVCVFLFLPGKNAHPYPLILKGQSIAAYCSVGEELSYFPSALGLLFSVVDKKRTGVFMIPRYASIFQIIISLALRKRYILKCHIRCGSDIDQLIQQINALPGLVGNILQVPVEGSLLADTYYYAYGTKRAELLEYMQAALQFHKRKLWYKYEHTTRVQSIDQAVILSSIVPLEAEIPEYKQVAEVFLNRLEIGMPLQADSTLLFLTKGIRAHRIALHEYKKINSPYNTYKNKGLPPGPISQPCVQSLEAVLSARRGSKALFFVHSGTGAKHTFSQTYAQHVKHVRKYKTSAKYFQVWNDFQVWNVPKMSVNKKKQKNDAKN